MPSKSWEIEQSFKIKIKVSPRNSVSLVHCPHIPSLLDPASWLEWPEPTDLVAYSRIGQLAARSAWTIFQGSLCNCIPCGEGRAGMYLLNHLPQGETHYWQQPIRAPRCFLVSDTRCTHKLIVQQSNWDRNNCNKLFSITRLVFWPHSLPNGL